MKPTSRLFWLCAVVTLINTFTSAGFSIAALLPPGTEHVNAMHGASRSISLALGAIVVVVFRSYSGLMILSLIMVLVQAGDALIGVFIHDTVKTLGPAFLATVTAGVLLILFRATASARKEHRQ